MTHVVAGRYGGYGLLALIVGMVIAALLAALALPGVAGALERSRTTAAFGEIGASSVEIDRFSLNKIDQFPATPTDLPVEIHTDPCGKVAYSVNSQAAKKSRNDIVHTNNGPYSGLAQDS